MKRKSLIVLGLAVMLGASSVLGVSANEFDSNRDANSNATFSFSDDGEGGEETTPPVDPEEPGETVDPEDPDENTGNKGPLRIDYVSNFKFGDHKITSGTQIFNAELVKATSNGQEVSVPNYVQVSDLRGKRLGWSLYVQQEQFKVVDGEYENEELNGAQIVLSNITANTVNATKASVPSGSIVLNGNGQKTQLMRAEEAVGYGTHVAYFGDYKNVTGDAQTAKNSVQLVVPAGTEKLEAAYKSVLTWTLTDAPGPAFQ